MRIAMVTPVVGDAYGQERVIRDSTLLLRQAGHEVFLLGDYTRGAIPPCDGVALVPGLSKINLFSRHLRGNGLKDRALRALKEFRPDVVHLVDQFDAKFQSTLCREYPLVFTAHLLSPTCPSSTRLTRHHGFCTQKSGWGCLSHHREYQCLAHFKSPLHRGHAIHDYLERREALKEAGIVIAISRFVERLLKQDGWTVPIELVYNPVKVPPSFNQRHELAPPLILCASRLERYKGVHTLIDALKRIEQRSWITWIYGDGPERSALTQQVRRYGLESRVLLPGQVPFETIQQTLKTTSLFVQPNVGPEPFGLSVAEASAHGVPVIAAKVPALDEIVEEGKTGLFFAADDASDLSQKLETLLEDTALRSRLGLAGHARILAHFSPERHLERTLQVYQKALGQEARPNRITSFQNPTDETIRTDL